jgi:hypothetical protein
LRVAIASYPVPGWILIVLVALAIIPLFTLLRFIFYGREPGYRQLYRTDDLYGARWQWEYSSDGAIRNLGCLCPVCQTELVYDEHIRDRIMPWRDEEDDNTRFICQHCNATKATFQGSRHHAIGMVEREIRRKVRTGEWKGIGSSS